MLKKTIYPGTFDPITNGHIDIIKRAVFIFKDIIIAVAKSPSKDAFFSYPERLSMVKDAVKGIKGVKVEGFNG
jgi:pantetheine-phosphate adenylyltransferase